MTPSPALFDHFVRQQHGLVTHPQLLTLGWSRHQIEHALRIGRLLPVQASVYRTMGTPVTYLQHLLAACLAAGPQAVISHRAAAHLWGLTSTPAPVELTVPYSRSPSPAGASVHRSTDLVAAHTTARQGIPVTNPLRLLVDLGAVVSDNDLATAIDDALLKDLVTVPDLYAMLDMMARRGRRGIGPLRKALADRPLGDLSPESVLEPVMARIIVQHGIDGVSYQHVVEAGGRTFRLDFGVPHVKLGIEVDGLEWHGTRAAAIRDRERRRLLQRAGWQLIEFTAKDMRRRPAR